MMPLEDCVGQIIVIFLACLAMVAITVLTAIVMTMPFMMGAFAEWAFHPF
jgi:hypothetical protein